MDVKIVNKSGFDLPKYETWQSAGMDLRSTEDITIHQGERKLIKTGIFIQLPTGYEAQIRSRSGLALKKGVFVLNSPGTIDADYRGEIGVILQNSSTSPYTVSSGDRIAQMVFAKFERGNLIPVKKLNDTERGSEGFGSTGK